MRLKKIKLAGFKSFVDPTSVDLRSNRVAIVGPNGCGKSNIIDAVRWVMGESSAKQLRGESMADVIFSGSVARAPVGQASVELVFDNAEGRLGGEYAAFSEIAVKRHVGRDGESNYFLNNARCRRKDITDIFLGTGLGARSYAIIEQGMISRLIEAKPDDLRIFLEEAAGISKYKERRRETETRLRHTRENLERLTDLRDELQKQLVRLEKQAEAARTYKELKTTLRQVSAEHLALSWRGLDEDMTQQQRVLAEQEILLEKKIAQMRQLDAEIETARAAYEEAQEGLQDVQSRYYRSKTEVSQCEQTLAYQRERQGQLEMDLAQVQESFEELQHVLAEDERLWQAMQSQVSELTPQASQLQDQYQHSYQILGSAEAKMHTWQSDWERLMQNIAHMQQHMQLARAEITHTQEKIQGANERLTVLEAQYATLEHSNVEEQLTTLTEKCLESEDQLSQTKAQLLGLQQQFNHQHTANEAAEQQLEAARTALHTLQNEYVSLQALQQAAWGDSDAEAMAWLDAQQLTDKQRLVQQLVVEPEWISAVETVLGDYLQAICVEKCEHFTQKLAEFTQGTLVLFENASTQAPTPVLAAMPLRDKIKTALAIEPLLIGVYCAASLDEALRMRSQLRAHESVITPEGFWLSSQWLRVKRIGDAQSGVLAREQRLQVLHPLIEDNLAGVQTLQQDLVTGKERAKTLHDDLIEAQQQLNQHARIDADLHAEQRALKVKQQELQHQQEKTLQEIDLIKQRLTEHQGQLTQVEASEHNLAASMANLSADRTQLEQAREQLNADLQQAKTNAHQDQSQSNQVHIQLSGLTHRLEATAAHVQRSAQQLAKLKGRWQQLQHASEEAGQPIPEMEHALEQALELQTDCEAAMQEARTQVDEVAHGLRGQEQARLQSETEVQDQRQNLEDHRLTAQTIKVKRDTVFEQLHAQEIELTSVLATLAADADLATIAQRVEKLEAQIKRLGAINLAAIDEHAEHAERLLYLDQQNADLLSALETLEQAIEKIDKETKQRFKDTFDTVNKSFGALFAQVFGGGNAYLELTENDLLNTGVVLMAQPPGKRNSTIHALSGGEKALTALSLVFAMFKLNPAPFCMLDEVDAPLDEANVMRFARLVKEMSEHIQFILITHNKTTMEMVDHLMGVTMKEAGVSRLVSVDVDKAAELAVA